MTAPVPTPDGDIAQRLSGGLIEDIERVSPGSSETRHRAAWNIELLDRRDHIRMVTHPPIHAVDLVHGPCRLRGRRHHELSRPVGKPEGDRVGALAPGLLEPQPVAVECRGLRQVDDRLVQERELHTDTLLGVAVSRLWLSERNYTQKVRSWIPVPETTSGRLVFAALDLFGANGYAPVGVADIAANAGVTTGSLYHHFGSKEGLYHLVRTDVERRVVDRLEGAAARSTVGSVSELAPVLLVGFDYLVSSGFLRLMGEPSPTSPDGTPRPDPVEEFVDRLLGGTQPPMSALVVSAWRTALWHASDGPDAALGARRAFAHLLTGHEIGTCRGVGST
jgi:AcrR family transcriptional regulator